MLTLTKKIFLLTLLLCLNIRTHAQSLDSVKPLLETTDEIANVYWSSDSQNVVFETQPIIEVTTGRRWYSTDLKFDHISPSLKEITPEQALVTLFGATSTIDVDMFRNLKRGKDYDGHQSLIIPSPNSLYYLYVGELQVMIYDGNQFFASPLILVDVLRNQSIVVPELPIYDIRNSTVFYHINWSQDSTAFTVSTRSDFAAENLYYVSAYSPELTNIIIEQTSSINVGGQIVEVSPEFSSLSENGKQVLLSGSMYTSEDIESNFIIWDVENPAMNQILLDENISSVSFSVDGKDIIFIGSDGLQKMNLMTKEVVLLDASIHSQWAYRAWFSPDRQWMAFLALGDSSDSARLYVIPVPN